MTRENHTGPVDLREKIASFEEVFAPRRIGHVNDAVIKVARIEGEFVWHKHDDTDELFLVQRGEMIIRYRDRDVTLSSGQLHVVPRGTEHTTLSATGCDVVIIERAATVNTGDARGHALTFEEEPFI